MKISKEEVLNFFKDKDPFLKENYLRLKNKYALLKQDPKEISLNKLDVQNYGVTRLPGTLSSYLYVLNKFASKLEIKDFSSILDFGFGPGTTMYAFAILFEQKFNIMALEKNSYFKDLALKAYDALNLKDNISLNIINKDIFSLDTSFKADIATFSYILSETKNDKVTMLLDKALNKDLKAIIIIDAGTKKSFENMVKARNFILSQHKWRIISPCPHQKECPLFLKDDFCHFPVTFNRTAQIICAKGASKNTEQEKFSYLIFINEDKITNYKQAEDIIVGKPIIKKGHVIFDLCTKEAVKLRTIASKKDSDYKIKKSLTWGDEYLS